MEFNLTELIGAILGSLSLWECIRYFLNRRNNRRIEDAEADGKEFGQLREYNEFLQMQLTEKEQRFVSQTDRLRHCQDDLFKTLCEKQAVELELQKYRCVVPKCLKREPQNGY